MKRSNQVQKFKVARMAIEIWRRRGHTLDIDIARKYHHMLMT